MKESTGEQHMAEGGGAHSIGMRLNQLPGDLGGSSGGQRDLASSPAEKRTAAKAIEDHIEPDAKKLGKWADDDTGAVVKELAAKDGHGWLMSGALKEAHKTWDEQVQNLMNRLSSEKAALRSSGTVLQGTDLKAGSGIRASSALDTL